MSFILFQTALLCEILASGGFIVYIIKQKKWMFRVSHWLLFSGFMFHTAFLIYRFWTLGTAPVLDMRSALSFFSWCIIAVYMAFYLKFRMMVLGSFVAPFAAFMLLISSSMPVKAIHVRPVFKSMWLTIHVFSVFIGIGLFTIACLVSIMYLIQEYHIKKKKYGSFYFSRLPSLATLDEINYCALIYGFPFLTIGIISGCIYAQCAFGTYWQWDPKEVLSLITWLLYAVLLHERLTVGWQGRKAAIMSILCFLVIMISFAGTGLFLGGYHSFSSMNTGRMPK